MKAIFVAGGTGGHVYPALAVARVYKEFGTDIYWVGRENSLEQKIALDENFFFEAINAQGFRGKGLVEKILSVFALFSSLISSAKIIKKIRPDFIFSCGGFTSLGPGIISFFLNIPLFIHEQNSVAGSANKLLSIVSLKTFEGFPSSFNKVSRVEFVGNPIRGEITSFMKGENFLKDDEQTKFNLLILGGSQGSEQLNSIVMNCLERIEEKVNWKIIHQSGKNDKRRLSKFYSKLKLEFTVEAFIKDMGRAYQKADLIVSRAGAMTIAELLAMRKPSILLPLPWATDNHQFFNASYLKEIGAAEVITSKEENSQKLANLISDLAKDKERRLSMSNSAKLSFVPNSAKKIFTKINATIKEKS